MNGFGSMLKEYLEFHKISQTDFASRLDISVKHMNEILNENTNISEELMLAISLITDIDVNFIFYVENKKRIYNYLMNNFKTPANINKFLNSFCLKEMSNKGWITLKDSESFSQNAMDLLNYLNVANFDIFDNYVDNKVLYKKKNDADLKKVYLWIKRCDYLISNQNVAIYKSSNLKLLLEELEIERNKDFDVSKLVSIFNKYGIYLVVCDALEGSKVRGCMLVKDNNPAIYMTCYLKEKSSFCFALYHEIGHIKSDYNILKNKIIVDDGDSKEQKADLFAINQMIKPSVWDLIINNYSEKEKICNINNIPLCFLYSRLAKEGYISYSSDEYQSHRVKIGL